MYPLRVKIVFFLKGIDDNVLYISIGHITDQWTAYKDTRNSLRHPPDEGEIAENVNFIE